MVGLFINTLPSRVVLDDNEPLLDVVTRLQDLMTEQTHALLYAADGRPKIGAKCLPASPSLKASWFSTTTPSMWAP